jgi:hypothetical protein
MVDTRLFCAANGKDICKEKMGFEVGGTENWNLIVTL